MKNNTKLSKEEKMQKIVAVLNYRDGSYYVGSLATCKLYGILNIPYGTVDGSVKFDRDIMKCSDKQIDAAFEYMKSYIDHMEKNPVRQCPCCGSIVREDEFIINPDTVMRQI